MLFILSNPKLVLNPATVVAPVPPLAMATMPVILVAFPVSVPAKAPLASRFTILFAKFELVALLAKLTPASISSLVFPPTVITVGLAAVPPKSPANKIFPLEVVVASATELVMLPEASDNALAI